MANQLGRSIGAFAIDGSTGLLTHVSDLATPGNPYRIAAHPSGRFVFEFDASTNVGTTGVTSFAIDPATGSLAPVNAVGTGVSPRALAVHPSGRFLYVGNYGGPDPQAGTGWIPNGSITIVSVNPVTGQLGVPLPALTTGRGARCMAMDPAGRFLYMDNSGTDLNFTPVLSSFAIDPATGALSTAAPDLVLPFGCTTVW